MASVELPEIIRRYQEAHDGHDAEAAVATFTPDARVFDDGIEYLGTDGVRTFVSSAAAEFNFTRSLLSASELGAGRWLVVNHVEGNFPGGEVDLRYHFTLTDGLISELVIAP